MPTTPDKARLIRSPFLSSQLSSSSKKKAKIQQGSNEAFQLNSSPPKDWTPSSASHLTPRLPKRLNFYPSSQRPTSYDARPLSPIATSEGVKAALLGACNIDTVDSDFSSLEDTNVDCEGENSDNQTLLANDIQTSRESLTSESDWEEDEEDPFNPLRPDISSQKSPKTSKKTPLKAYQPTWLGTLGSTKARDKLISIL